MVMDRSNIEKKISNIKDLFGTSLPEEKIQRLMNLGRSLAPYPDDLKTAAHQVPGCQSTLYLSARFEQGQIIFAASSDALVSAGLAALLIAVYSGETPDTILKTPPDFLKEIGLLNSLTPSRLGGLAHIHQRMKKDALKFLLSNTKTVEHNSPSL